MSRQISERLEWLVPHLVKVVATTGYLVVHETLGRVVYADQVVEGREQPPLTQAVCLLTLGDEHFICPSEALRWCIEGTNPPGPDLLTGVAEFTKIIEKWGIIRIISIPESCKVDKGLGPTELGFKVIKFGENKKHLISKFEFKTFFKKLKGTDHAQL